MKHILIILKTMLFFTSTVFAQQNIANKTWTNGDMEYRVSLEKNSFIFEGFDRNEGGFGFALNKQTDGKLQVSEIQNASVSYYCSEQYLGSTVEYKNIKGQELLFFRNKKGAIVDIFTTGKLQDMLTNTLIRYLAGSYTDASGKVYVFSADAARANGFGSAEQYTFDNEYYVPDFIISFANNKTYRISRKPITNGVRLHFEPYSKDDYDQWQASKTGQSFTLTKTIWTNNSNDENIQGRYPFTSLKVLTRGELIVFTNDELDIMRNEIFARHGHIFKTDRYRNYFNAQSWYSGLFEDATNRLSEIEKLNIEQIKAVQEYLKKAN